MSLRMYVSIVLGFLVVVAFIFLGIQNYERGQKIKELEKSINQRSKIIKEQDLPQRAAPPPPPLPVCAKGINHPGCRSLAADESGATIRGVRDENPND